MRRQIGTIRPSPSRPENSLSARPMQVAPIRIETLTLRGMLCFALTYAVASLWLPFGWDHGIMASVGDAIVRGGLPYRDGWDMKGPLAYFIFAISEVLFGQVMWGIRIVELVILMPALYLIFRIVAVRTTPTLAAWTGLALYLWIASNGWFFTAQPEVWVTAASVIAIYPFLMPGALPSERMIFLCGVFIGCASLFKFFYLAYGLVPLTALLVSYALSVRQAFRPTLWLATGAAVPVILMVGYLAAYDGLMEAINVHLRYTALIYSRLLDWKSFFVAVIEFLTQGTIVISIPFVALSFWTLRNRDRAYLPIAIWLGLTLFFVILQTKAFTYHWYPLYAPYIILAALGLDALRKSAPALLPVRIIALGASMVFFSQIVPIPAKEIFKVARYLSGFYSVEAQYDRYRFRLLYNAGDEIRAARYIEAHSKPTDSVFVWGVDATARFLSHRPNSTRFTFNLPLTIASPFRKAYRTEMMHVMDENPPKYIIVGFPWEMDEKKTSFFEFSEFRKLVMQRYTLDVSFGILDLYRRQPS